MPCSKLFTKYAQEALLDTVTPTTKRIPPRRTKRYFPEVFPSYSKSLVSQLHGDPTAAGLTSAMEWGIPGAITGAGIGSAVDSEDRIRGAVLGALLAGLLTGGAAYVSGKGEQEKENSRLLFLRRLGIDSPGELEAVSKYPEAGDISERVTKRRKRV